MTHAQPPAIELRNVGLMRDGRWILRDINWTVRAGSCAAILGPNGSGKSTLTRIVACHVWPTAGESIILGGHFGEANLLDIRKSIRLVQAAGPYDVDPELSAIEVVLSGIFGTIGLYDEVNDAMRADAERLLKQVGLAHVATHRYATLSSGERVRSLLARALITKPKLLLLDEPTAGLDLLAREQVLATIEAMFGSKRGVGVSPTSSPDDERGRDAHATNSEDPPTVILITHHVEELPPATSEILLLEDGHIAAHGPPDSVLRNEILSKVYRCPLHVRHSNGRRYIEVNPNAWNQLLDNPAK